MKMDGEVEVDSVQRKSHEENEVDSFPRNIFYLS